MSHPRFPIPRLHLPMRRPEDVIPCLRGGARHRWQRHSAHALGTTWSRANGLPAAVPLVLDGHARFAGAELVDAFLERTVDLRDGYRPSQVDLLAVLGIADGLAVMAVEGKVQETCGARIDSWLRDSPSRNGRLDRPCRRLGLPTAGIGQLR